MPSWRDLQILSWLAVRQHFIERLKAPVMPLLLIFTWALAAGFVGNLGIEHLFWHYRTQYYVTSCLAIGGFIAGWCYVSVLIDSDHKWFLRLFLDGRTTITLSRLSVYLVLSSVILCGLMSTSNLVYVSRAWLPTGTGSFFGSWLLMVAGSLIVALGGATLHLASGSRAPQHRLTRWFDERRLKAAQAKDPDVTAQDLAPWWLHRNAMVGTTIVMTGLAVTGIYALAGNPVLHPRTDPVPPATSYALLALLVVLIYGPFLYYRAQGWIWTVSLTLLAGGAVAYVAWSGGSPPIRDFDEVRPRPYAEVVEASYQGSSETTTILEAHEAPYLVVVAVSGGGIRAQVWATIVLNVLERNLNGGPGGSEVRFHDMLRMVTGTSGGMVGATYYVATLREATPLMEGAAPDATHLQYDGSELTHEQMIFSMCRDTLTPTVKAFLFHDAVRNVIPNNRNWPEDRGRILEDSWAYWTGGGPQQETNDWNNVEKINSPFNRALAELKPAELAGHIPCLVYAPTIAEDGRRLVISNWKLDELVAPVDAELPLPEQEGEGAPEGQGEQAPAKSVLSVSAVQASRVFPDAMKKLKLKTAARLNANFPFVISSPYLPTEPDLHILDAGYYDNYGNGIAGQWLYANRHRLQSMREDSDNPLQGILLIQISASSLNRVARGAAQNGGLSEPSVESSSLPEAGGFAATSFQKTTFLSDRRITALQSFFNKGPGSGEQEQEKQQPREFFKFASLEFDADVSLSWYLTPAEAYALLHPFLEDNAESELTPRLQLFDSARLERAFTDEYAEFADARRVYATQRENAKGSAERMKPFRRHDQTGKRCRATLRDLKKWWSGEPE